jgi:prolyl-tRNA synthetase
MKDLYTFDHSTGLALETYESVRAAYVSLFDELKIPYLVAEADSGDMGGNLSHEFHFPTAVGEDHVISCKSCGYVANEELAETSVSMSVDESGSEWSYLTPGQIAHSSSIPAAKFTVWRGISKDRATLVNVWYGLAADTPSTSQPEVNTHAVKAIFPNLDSGVESATNLWKQTVSSYNSEFGVSTPPPNLKVINLVDQRLPPSVHSLVCTQHPALPFQPVFEEQSTNSIESSTLLRDPLTGMSLNLLRIRDGDDCPRCQNGSLEINKAIELGHTFFLGTRYSDPLKAIVTIPRDHALPEHLQNSLCSGDDAKSLPSDIQVSMQMGCHGIGVSRMMGAVAETLADDKGLNWPRVIAPFEVVIVPAKGCGSDAVTVYDALVTPKTSRVLDLVLDDRSHSFAWKMHDADLIGYPVIVVVGKGWKARGTCEVQCRRLGLCEDIPLDDLATYVERLLVQL